MAYPVKNIYKMKNSFIEIHLYEYEIGFCMQHVPEDFSKLFFFFFF